MPTECTTDRLVFQPLGRREVVAAFDGGTISSDSGGLLLREVEKRAGINAKPANYPKTGGSSSDSVRREHPLPL